MLSSLNQGDSLTSLSKSDQKFSKVVQVLEAVLVEQGLIERWQK